MTDIHYKLRKKGGLIHQMHKSQSNVTIAMTEFDNLRELNAYAIDIARDYFAMAANDPRREETAREILRLTGGGPEWSGRFRRCPHLNTEFCCRRKEEAKPSHYETAVVRHLGSGSV